MGLKASIIRFLFHGFVIVFFFFTMVSVCGLGLSGCSSDSLPEEGRYYNRDKGFSIKFPEEWSRKEGDGFEEPLIEATSPWESDYDEFSEFVSVDVEDLEEGMSLDDYFYINVKIQSEEMDGFRERERGQVEIDKVNTKWIIFDFEVDGSLLTSLSYVFVKEQKGYYIFCVSEIANFPEYKDKFEEISESFKFE
jgi:hypothetical protein